MASGNPRPGRHDPAVSNLARLRLGTHLTVRDFVADRGLERSAALAYISLLSLVPLLATVAALYRAFFTFHASAWLLLLGPYLLFWAIRLLTRPLRRHWV